MICGGNNPSLAINEDSEYQEFCKKYDISLNLQQERALCSIDGANMLLAVPGSGKTTVLVARLGYMVLCKKILPEKIIAITFNVAAKQEMEKRFKSKFGEVGQGIEFRTLNSLSYSIYIEYCKTRDEKAQRHVIEDIEKQRLLQEIFKKYNDEYATENDVLELSSVIAYIKNMMLTQDQIREKEMEYPHLYEMYQSYQDELNKKNWMDFDDQLVYAYGLLQKRKKVVEAWRAKYKYICVDEAQDTSKIQHEIIKILSEGNNLFMVGDDDQSIYGFRGAYPEALLSFGNDYHNPYILRMEHNYRSTNQIVEKAQMFVSKNKGRYEKNMTAERGDGKAVGLEQVNSRETQYMRLLEIAKVANTETAFLYRDNDSSVVLIDLLLRNNVPFRLHKPEKKFFGNRVVKDILAYLSLAIDEFNTEALRQICNKGILFLKTNSLNYAVKNCLNKHISVYDALAEQMKYVEYRYRNRATDFRNIMSRVSKAKTYDAISILLSEGYSKYLNENSLDYGKVEILQVLAKQEPTIKEFLTRIQELEHLIDRGFKDMPNCRTILSTIHSSKGLEYDSVYMVDVYDGRFPSSRPNIFGRSKDNSDGAQEERRLFYVGMTRAKNRLAFFSIKDRPSSFLKEIFPELQSIKPKEQQKQQNVRKPQIVQANNSGVGQNCRCEQPLKMPVIGYQYQQDCPVVKVGMKLLHKDLGKLTVVEVEEKNEPKCVIITVEETSGNKRRMAWNVMYANNLVEII